MSLDSKDIKPVNPKGNPSWIFIGRTDAEAEALVLWPSDAKCWVIGKDPDAGKNWGQEEKGAREDEMIGWHHWLNGHECEQTLGDGEGLGSLECCSPWVAKSQTRLSDWTTSGLWNKELDKLEMFCRLRRKGWPLGDNVIHSMGLGPHHSTLTSEETRDQITKFHGHSVLHKWPPTRNLDTGAWARVPDWQDTVSAAPITARKTKCRPYHPCDQTT